MILKIKDFLATKVESLEEASRLYCATRDEHQISAELFPFGEIIQQGQPTLRISYNGRIWNGDQAIYTPERFLSGKTST